MYLIDGILYFSLVDMDIELLTPSKSVYQLYKEFSNLYNILKV